MKRIYLLLAILLGSLQLANAQQQTLQFNKDGKFKIVQFTDVHYIYNDPRSDVSIERINQVLDMEKPDLVLFTGDVIYGKPAEEGMRTVLNLVSKRKIPFAVTFGNHDNEQGLSREELLKIIQSVPFNLTQTTPGISGVTNFILPVKASDGKRNATVLYCIDSHSYSQIKGVNGYDYIKFDQIQWYRENSKKFTEENNGVPVSSYAFFHIALPEYNQAASSESAILYGIRKEKACAPQLNSGLFAAMKEMGDVRGVFVGHDHDDDYAVSWKGILLAYGRYTGGNTVYNHLTNGARVIELDENANSFRTWIRLKEGVVQQVTYPADFMLIASMNPCPCGNYGSATAECKCTPSQIHRYLNKLSGPLLDRIDLHVEVDNVSYDELNDDAFSESSQTVRERVNRARNIQLQRLQGRGRRCNAQMTSADIKKFCKLDGESQKLLQESFEKLHLSARAYNRILKVARTIADLDNSENIRARHVAEALQYRALDRKYRV